MGGFFAQQNAIDYGSAKTLISVVKDDELAWSYRTLRFIERNLELVSICANGAGLIGLPIAHFRHAFQATVEADRSRSDPARIRGDEPVAKQQLGFPLCDD
jgi:hypothetical protein